MSEIEKIDSVVADLLAKKNYVDASLQLEDRLRIENTDTSRRKLVSCLVLLNDKAVWERIVDVASSIEEKVADDFVQIATSQYFLKDFDNSIKNLNTGIMIEPSSWAYYMRAKAKMRGKYSFSISQSDKIEVIHDLNNAISLPEAFDFIYTTLAEFLESAEADRVLQAGLIRHPKSKGIRTTIASKFATKEMYRQAFELLEPLIEEKDSEILGQALHALIMAKENVRALEVLDLFPDEDKKLPGYAQIKADVLIDLSKFDSAIVYLNKEIASNDSRRQIIALFTRAQLSIESKKFPEAIRDASNALNLCFENEFFDICTDYFWFKFYRGHNFHDKVMSVCKFLDINDADSLATCEEQVRWKARFILWRQKHLLGTEVLSVERLKEFEEKIKSPSIAEILSERYIEEGLLVDGVKCHLNFCKWDFSKLTTEEKNKKTYYFYFDQSLLPNKTESTKLHKMLNLQMKNASSIEELRSVFVQVYDSLWSPLLHKHKMLSEMREISHSLVTLAPQESNLVWDYAYSHSDMNDAECNRRCEWGYREYLKIRPNSGAACHNLSLLLERTDRKDEAWSYVQKAYEIDPKHSSFANRFKEFSTWAQKRQEECKKSNLAIQSSSFLLSKPIIFENLSLRQRLYLSALLRCCLQEDQGRILSVNEGAGKLSPSQEYTDKIICDLWSDNIIVVDPDSMTSSYSIADDGEMTIKCAQVRWILNLKSSKGLSREKIISALCEPAIVEDREVETAIELWKEISLEECLEYLQHKRQSVRLYAEIGDKTRESFDELLNWFSSAQIHTLIWSVVPKALADFETGKFTSRTHAANTIPGRCKAYGERARASQWNLNKARRDFECRQSVISEMLFFRYLLVGDSGFNNKPGDFSFSSSVLPPPTSEESSGEYAQEG